MEKMMGKGDVGFLLGQKAFFLHLLQFKLQECTTIDGPYGKMEAFFKAKKKLG